MKILARHPCRISLKPGILFPEYGGGGIPGRYRPGTCLTPHSRKSVCLQRRAGRIVANSEVIFWQTPVNPVQFGPKSAKFCSCPKSPLPAKNLFVPHKKSEFLGTPSRAEQVAEKGESRANLPKNTPQRRKPVPFSPIRYSLFPTPCSLFPSPSHAGS